MTIDLFSVRGKKILVTGGTRGIGYMIAEGLLKSGAEVIISSRKPDACAEAQASLSEFGTVRATPADLSDVGECARLIGEVDKVFGGELDVLVNNAGAAWGAPIAEFPEMGWDRVMDTNVKGPFFLIQAALPLLEKASADGDPARVVNIGSIDGLTAPVFDNFSYGASKAAIHHLTVHLAATLGPSILVNAIAPGPFPTKMMEHSLTTMGDEIRSWTRVNRVGTMEDVAGTVIYLSSRASAYVTGSILPLDGGMSTTGRASAKDE